ncbi:hypothetical protein IKA15_00480 [bacterium]|nr:hypothetical protein [bacterium]
MKKFFISIFIFSVIVQQVFAHGKEFKNMLVDLEIGRAGEDTYKVNLKTEVPYPDEIKIVKKSDYNYYILLAETYSLIKTTKSQGTIQSIKVDTYPYAEQNFENGFTKVTFNTTRPVEFIVSLSANRASKFPVMDLVRLARLDNLYKENNFDYLNPKYKVAEAKLPEKTVQKEVKTAKKEAPAQKIAQATAKAPVVKKIETPQKETPKAVQKEVAKQVQNETAKVATVTKPQTVAKTPVVPKVDVKKAVTAKKEPATPKATVPQKVAVAQKAVAPKPVTVQKEEPAQKTAVKEAIQKPTVVQKATQPQTIKPEVKTENKPTVDKKQVEKPAPQAPKANDSIKAPKADVQTQTPPEIAQVDMQIPKDIPQVSTATEDKVPENIELEPIDKIDEEPVQNDFKNMLLSFFVGNKTGVFAGLVLALLLAVAAISASKKKTSSQKLVPVINSADDDAQAVQNFEDVLSEENEEARNNEVQTQTTEAPEYIEPEVTPEVQKPQIPEEVACVEQKQTEEQQQNVEIISQEETTFEEGVTQDETPEVVASVQIEETPHAEEPKEIKEAAEPQAISQTEVQETIQAEIIEPKATEEVEEIKSTDEIEEEIRQEIRYEIENENVELIQETEETEEEILEVADIKEEIVSAMGDALDSKDDEIELIQEKDEISENIQVHNLDLINRQAASGNYEEDEDLIELDTIKDEIAEIKNNLLLKKDIVQEISKEVEQKVEISEIQQEEVQIAPKISLRANSEEVLKPAPVQKQLRCNL